MITNFSNPTNLSSSLADLGAMALVAALVSFVVLTGPVLRYVNGQARVAD